MIAENCWWTVDDVSRYLQVSKDTIYRWIEKSHLLWYITIEVTDE